jgi:sulfur-oxidizing protein SoxY
MKHSRRTIISGAIGASTLLLARFEVKAQAVSLDYPDDLTAALRKYTNGATWKEQKVDLDVAELVDNGNTVPLTVTVVSAMSGTDYVKSIAVFNEKNPNRDVVRFVLSEDCGKAEVATRIRLATTQRLVAIAAMGDGSFCTKTIEVIVTLASCIEVD